MTSFSYNQRDVQAASNSLVLLKLRMKTIPACARFFQDKPAPARRGSNPAVRAPPAQATQATPPPAPAPIARPPPSVPAAFTADVDDHNDVYDAEPRIQCPHCQRSFVESSFEKHQKICYKVFVKKREAFDSTAMRLGDREDAAVTMKKLTEEKRKQDMEARAKAKAKAKDAGGIKKWKIQSLQFQASLGNQEAAAELAALESQGVLKTVPGVADDKVQCQYCGRTFSSDAAKRHIPVCETNAQKSRVTGKNYGPTALKKGAGIQASANVKKR